ncbi:MAG: NAD+ synthase (glutamine-hydrolyzing), partial [Myxococcota bacterium]
MIGAPVAARVAAASLNQTVGDWSGNLERIQRAIGIARAKGVRLLLLPEMCIPGYSLGDRLMMRGTLERSWRVLEQVIEATEGMVVLVGLPVRHRDVMYNVVAVCADRRLVGLVPKENLATGDVQYENRWFSGWPRGAVEAFDAGPHGEVPLGALLFEAAGLGRFAVEVCEDGWKGIRPGSIAALAGAHLVANPSASWFVLGKHRVRRRMVEQISREDKVVYLYSSLLGCDATRLVFDGSVFVAQDGEVLEEGRRFLFTEDMEFVDCVVDLAALERARMEEGSWRQQVASLQREDFGGRPQLVRVPGAFHTDAPPPTRGPYWLAGTQPHRVDPSLDWLVEAGLIAAPRREDLPYLELELALCLGLREYWIKCGIRGFTLALSGGRDSGMVALLVHRMFRYHRPELDEAALRAEIGERFSTAYLATENSGDITRGAARGLAEALGATHHEVGIQDAVDTHVRLFAELTGQQLTWDRPEDDVPLQNVQARLRGSLIWMLANVQGHLLLATSNKSEAAVGYTTMDGD